MAATIMRVLRVSIAAVAGLTDSVIEAMVTGAPALSLECVSQAYIPELEVQNSSL
jgi:hypothetical protein